MSRLTIETWRTLVFKSQHKKMTAAVKVLCLYLADHMNPQTRNVSLKREDIAEDLGIHHARVGERFTSACAAGYLNRVSAGRRGHGYAVYQAIAPTAESIRQSGKQSTRKVTGAPDAIETRGAVSNSRSIADRSTGRTYQGDHGEFRDSPCEWHPWSTCPADCANADPSEARGA